MTGKERMKIAMRMGEPDRVPVMCQLSMGHLVVNADCPPVEMSENGEATLRNYLNLIKRYRFDGLLITSLADNSKWKENISSIENTPEGQIATFKDGRKVVYPFDESPHPFERGNPQSLCETDIETIDTGDTISGYFTYGAERYVKEAGRYLSVHSDLASPFTLFVERFGITEPLTALVENPDICVKIIEKYTLFYINVGKALIDRGVDALKISSPWGGSSLISRETYKKFVLPCETTLVQSLKAYRKDIIIYNHTCGFISDRLELIADTGIDGIECMDPPPLGDVDLAEAKKRVGKKVFLKGNLDSPNVLLKFTREEVKEIAKKKIFEGGPGGGYILSSSCSVSPHVPPENIEVLTEAAEKYGRYHL